MKIGHTFIFDYGEYVEGCAHNVVVTVSRDASLEEMIAAFSAYLTAAGFDAGSIAERLSEDGK